MASWPMRQELQRAVEERSLESLGTLEEGVEGLCRRLGADPHDGLPEGVPDHALRQEAFGSAQCAERRQKAFYEYIWEAMQDKILLLLLGIGTVELVVKMVLCPEEREEAWVEPLAIYVTVAIVVGVQSAMDYKRARLFDSLSQKVAASNLRFVIRGGKQVSLPDGEIVVGDVVAFNSHLAAIVPADGVLLSGEGVRADESALTGEPEAIPKDAASPFILSGTTIVAGQGRMLVVAVGAHSVAGKIKKAVYSEEDVQSPLFEKLDRMANSIGRVGTTVAALVFAAACVQGFAIRHQPAHAVIDYLLLSLGVLAVAVPEGLPLALTISLAISSNRMSYQSNLVKTLDSCETMGSVTTICTDKTGTLTANRMAVGAAYLGGVLLAPDGGGKPVGRRLREAAGLSDDVKALVGNLVSVCSMDESHLGQEGTELRFHGNPTECAMLQMVQDCGFSYEEIRQGTSGRSASSRQHGVVNGFTSGRKLMSWAVPKPGGGGYRLYAKGASEIVLGRVTSAVGADGAVWPLSAAERDRVAREVVEPFARMAYRTVGLAFRDMEEAPGDAPHESLLNADGSRALACETGLTLVGVLGISDPLRPEVPRAISQCYSAGIDVRMVTGDALPTAVAIAKEAGILDAALHCYPDGEPKPFRAMEGKIFRQHVHTRDDKGDLVFSQEKFDDIWPYLRVLARSSPEDKLTLAKGLRASRLFLDGPRVQRLRQEDDIDIFPDVQVVAMTGDGTNDAPALKAADVGFAMGIAGTQIAKDAANIVLMDDNFASIVTAAKWGRNVFDCVQKFLQFQLTVNIAVLVVLSVVCLAGIPSPLNLLHLLWLNMIMDSLASVALASEPPTDRLLTRPPVNRSASIVTPRMWYNMIGHALYQVLVILAVLFSRASLPFLRDPGDGVGVQSKQYTVIFNVFVLMQLSNEYNARCLEGEWNVFKGVGANPTFLGVSACTLLLQGLMAQFGGKALHLHPDGLDTTEWAFCLFLGVGPILWQFFLNVAQRLVAVLAERAGARAHVRGPGWKLRAGLQKAAGADEESEAQSEATTEPAAGQKGLPAFMV